MKYQIIIAGFGGQGVVFLVKLLALCAGSRDIAFLGTENHGMSQRGGAVSCDIKIGDFSNPVIDKNQANLIIGLDSNESLRNIEYLKQNGTMVTNAKDDYPKIPFKSFCVDANQKAIDKAFPIGGLNVYMLGITLGCVDDFPFSIEEIKAALKQINQKVAKQNLDILDMAINDVKIQGLSNG